MSTLQVVAMFCGPREGEDGSVVSMSRIDAAIALALELEAPLLIAGDGHQGVDTALFAKRATARGVRMVVDLYSGRYERPNTLTDAIEIAECLLTHSDLADVCVVYVVTDEYHVTRASYFLAGELERLFAGSRPSPGVSMRGFAGFPVTDKILANEAEGLRQYREDRENYGYTRPANDPLHPHFAVDSAANVRATAK